MALAEVPFAVGRVVAPSLGLLAIFILMVALIEEWITRSPHRDPALDLPIAMVKWWARLELILGVYYAGGYVYRAIVLFQDSDGHYIALTVLNYLAFFGPALVPAVLLLVLLNKANQGVTEDEVRIREELRESQRELLNRKLTRERRGRSL